MCNSVLWRCTIWMYRGGHLILSSVRAEYYDRAMKIRRSMFSVMSPKVHLMPTHGSLSKISKIHRADYDLKISGSQLQ